MPERVEITPEYLKEHTEVVHIDAVQMHPRNAWLSDEEKLQDSIKAHGQFRPIVVSADGYILAGNHTWLAAKNEEKERVAVSRLPVNHDDPQALEIMIADNYKGGEWDEGLLVEHLKVIQDEFDTLAGTLLKDDFLDKYLKEEAKHGITGDPDDAPAKPNDPISRPGDLWLLGQHSLYVGDATDPEAVERAVSAVGLPVSLVWTDPPYGVDYVGKTADALTIQNDERSDEAKQVEFLRDAFTIAKGLCRKDGAAWYVTGPPGPLELVFGGVLEELGLLKQILVWVKDQFVMGRSDYHYRHEFIFYGWSEGGKRFIEERSHDSVWEIPRPRRADVHPTMKPVELIERSILHCTKPGELVLDPFAGSGSTLIAAEKNGRRAALVEIDPKYADVICRRFRDATDTKPVRVEDGRKVPYAFDQQT